MPPKLVQHLYKHLCVALLLLPALLFAGPEAKDYDIPEGEARSTLRKFAAQSNEQVMYTSDAIAGVRTKAVKGSFSVAEGLERMLTGTDLVIVRDEKSGAVRIVREEKANAKNAERAASRNDRPQKDEVADKKVELPVFEVMGSKLLNMDVKRSIDDPQPYLVFGQKTIERSGAVNLQDFFRLKLTQAGGALAQREAATFSGAISEIDLRGMGNNRTLILIDGRRVPRFTGLNASDSFQANLNGIPLAAIDHIDVLPATASAIYGGDAVAGAINIVMRRDYQGGELRLSYDNTFESDVARRRVDLNAGFNIERLKLNILVTASASEQNGLTYGDRSFNEEYIARLLVLNPSVYAAGSPPLGATANIRSSAGNLQLKPQFGGAVLNSLTTSLPVGYSGVASDNGAALVANAGRYNTDPAASAQQGSSNGARAGQVSPSHTESASLTFRQPWGKRIEAYLEGAATNTTTLGLLSSIPTTFMLAPAAPTNPFLQTIQVTVPNSSQDDGQLESTAYERRLAGGLIVDLPRDWKGNLDLTWNTNRWGYRTAPAFLAVGTSAITSGTVDLLRDPVLFPVDLKPYLTAEPRVIGMPVRTSEQIATVRVAGPVANLPTGTPQLTTLVEYRNSDRADAEIRQFGDTTTTLLSPSKSQEVWSGYMELRVPLVPPGGWRLARQIQLQTAVRHDDYTTNGSSENPTVANPLRRRQNRVESTDWMAAVRWDPTKDLSVRASYGTGFLPPSIKQLVPTFSTNLSITDPRRGNSVYSLQPGQRISSGSGNPDLRPEKSESYSVGFIVAPRLASGFRLSLDYIDISLTDAIATIPGGVLANETLFAQRVQRGPKLASDPADWAGPLIFLDESLANVASQRVQSYDLQMSYSRATESLGTWEVSVNATWQPHRITRTLSGQPLIEQMGYDVNGVKFKGNAGLSWSRACWTVGWNTYHYPHYFTYSAPTPTTNPATIASFVARQGSNGYVASELTHDASLAYDFGHASGSPSRIRGLLKNASIQLGVRNIFNRAPSYRIGFPSPLGDPRMASYYISLKNSL